MRRVVAIALGLIGCASPSSQRDERDASAMQADGDAALGESSDAGQEPQTSDEDASSEDSATPASEDASLGEATSPIGAAYAETDYALLKPAALAPLLGQARQLLGDGRLFVNGYSSAGTDVMVEYGAADPVADNAFRFQFPEEMRSRFRASVQADDALTYTSEPFTYRLLARVNVLVQVQYVSMIVRDTVYEARFDPAFTAIQQGTLAGALTRREAESSTLELGLACAAYCPAAYCAAQGVHALSDLLDCQQAPLDLDRNGDGTPDAYRVELRFSSQRVALRSDG